MTSHLQLRLYLTTIYNLTRISSILGDFNENEHNPKMQFFLSQQGCTNIIKNKTCFKSFQGPCIDLILTSEPNLHHYTLVFESGISDYHLMVYIMPKSTYTKLEPKNFSKEYFHKNLKFGLSNDFTFSHFNNELKSFMTKAVII